MVQLTTTPAKGFCADQQVIAALSSYSKVPKRKRSKLRCALSQHKERGELALIFPRRKMGQNQREERSGPVWLTTEMVLSLAVGPLTQAAQYLGISATALKKACRQLGIERWPYHRTGRPEGCSMERSASASGDSEEDGPISPEVLQSQIPEAKEEEEEEVYKHHVTGTPGLQPSSAPVAHAPEGYPMSAQHAVATPAAYQAPAQRPQDFQKRQAFESAVKREREGGPGMDDMDYVRKAKSGVPMIEFASHGFDDPVENLGALDTDWMAASCNKADEEVTSLAAMEESSNVNREFGDVDRAVAWHNRGLLATSQHCRQEEGEDFRHLVAWGTSMAEYCSPFVQPAEHSTPWGQIEQESMDRWHHGRYTI